MPRTQGSGRREPVRPYHLRNERTDAKRRKVEEHTVRTLPEHPVDEITRDETEWAWCLVPLNVTELTQTLLVGCDTACDERAEFTVGGISPTDVGAPFLHDHLETSAVAMGSLLRAEAAAGRKLDPAVCVQFGRVQHLGFFEGIRESGKTDAGGVHTHRVIAGRVRSSLHSESTDVRRRFRYENIMRVGVPSLTTSGNHFEILPPQAPGTAPTVRDMGSFNGTFLSRRRTPLGSDASGAGSRGPTYDTVCVPHEGDGIGLQHGDLLATSMSTLKTVDTHGTVVPDNTISVQAHSAMFAVLRVPVCALYTQEDALRALTIHAAAGGNSGGEEQGEGEDAVEVVNAADKPARLAQAAVEVESAVACVVCMQTMAWPVSVDCGHSLCFSCMRLWIMKCTATAARCPVCRDTIKAGPNSRCLLRPNLALDRVCCAVMAANHDTASVEYRAWEKQRDAARTVSTAALVQHRGHIAYSTRVASNKLTRAVRDMNMVQ